MSLDQVLGGLLGKSGAGGSGGQAGAVAALIPVISSLLAGGGLEKLMQGFKQNGLEEQANSWVGKGENKPISGGDVQKVLGQEKVAEVAKQANISEDQAADVLAQAIPAAVNHVTPEGSIPDAPSLDSQLKQVGSS
jgi:uncharacterized protein YidB (DUF937 family)